MFGVRGWMFDVRFIHTAEPPSCDQENALQVIALSRPGEQSLLRGETVEGRSGRKRVSSFSQKDFNHESAWMNTDLLERVSNSRLTELTEDGLHNLVARVGNLLYRALPPTLSPR